ncbi:MAG: hypothetical protein ABI877_04540 [Gemmatimonadaceae bacterium]
MPVGAALQGYYDVGMTAGESWIPGKFPGMGRALPFDNDLESKAAFFSMATRILIP